MRFFLTILLLFLASCNNARENDMFFNKLTAALENKKIVKFSEVADFDFDEVCIFQKPDSAEFSASDLLKEDVQRKRLETKARLSGKYFIVSFRSNKKIIKNYSYRKTALPINGEELNIKIKQNERMGEFCGGLNTILTVTEKSIIVSD